MEESGEKWRILYFYTVIHNLGLKLDRFLGNIDAKTDIKGRVFVPAPFRRILQTSGNTKLVLKMDVHQKCLTLYPENVFNEEVDNMRLRLNKWNPDQQGIFRKFVRDVEVLEIDTNGRILIPKKYLQTAEITSDVCFLGMNNVIELWAKNKLEDSLPDEDKFREGIEKFMS